MHGDDVFYAEQANGVGGFAGAHGIEIADGKKGEVGFMEFADEFHVAEKGSVAGVINGEAAGHANDEACGFAGVNADAVVLDGVRMKGVGHGDVEIADGLRAALAHGTDLFFETLFPDVETSFEDGDDFGMELFGEGEKIAEMVGVCVREKDSVEASEFLEGGRADRVGRDPGIDESDLTGGSGEGKSGVAEVRYAIVFCVEHSDPPWLILAEIIASNCESRTKRAG